MHHGSSRTRLRLSPVSGWAPDARDPLHRTGAGAYDPGPEIGGTGGREMPRPKAALVMIPGVDQMVLTASARAAIEELVELIEPGAVDLDHLDDDALAQMEVIVGSWGCNILDEVLLARMPKLRLLAY